MTIVELLLLLLIAGLCGTMSQMLSGYSHGGCLVAIVLGFVGTLLGSYLARLTGLPDLFTIDVGARTFPVVWSIVGGVVFSVILGLVTRRRTIVD
ncbi:MAG: hypothetical protein R3C10_13785 [Pirellulales bacterium]